MQKHQTSEDTHYSKIRSTVSVHSPQQRQRHLQQHQACCASTLTLAPSKRCSIPQRQCNQPSMDVLKEIRRACLGHNVVPSISGARPSGRRQRVRSVAEQLESHNCNRHGLLCSCQQQSLHSVGGHYNIRLFKLNRVKRRRNFANFALNSGSLFVFGTFSANNVVVTVNGTVTETNTFSINEFVKLNLQRKPINKNLHQGFTEVTAGPYQPYLIKLFIFSYREGKRLIGE